MRKFLPFLLVLLLLAGAAFKCNEDTVSCHDVCNTYAVCLGDDGMTLNADGICGLGEKYAGDYDSSCHQVCE